MFVTKRSESVQKGRVASVMITIVHDGISETRHCKPTADGFQGYLLDKDRAIFSQAELLSKHTNEAIRNLGWGNIPQAYSANLFYTYKAGDHADEYRAHCKAENERLVRIGQRQLDEYEKARVAYEAKRIEAESRRKAA